MKKISFSQLESARKNPASFARSLTNPDNNQPRFSKFMAWQLSVFEYHKKKGDISKAVNYFEATYYRNFVNNLKNEREKEEWIAQLQSYTKDDIKKKLTYIEHKKRISIPLTSKIRFGGEIPLIKMNNKGGYSLYFFSRKGSRWEEELRFPILQNYIAKNIYNVDLSEVEIGVYSLQFNKHLQTKYSETDVQEAIKELNSIGKSVSSHL